MIPQSDDVLAMSPRSSGVECRTFQVADLIQALKNACAEKKISANLFSPEGEICNFLSARSGGGWQEGRIRLRLEFVPDEEEDPPSPAHSLLDDLRR